MDLQLGTHCSLTRMPEAGDTYIGLVFPPRWRVARGTPVSFAGEVVGHVHYFEWQDPQPVLQLYAPLPLRISEVGRARAAMSAA